MNSSTLSSARDIGKDAGTGDNEFFGIDAFGFNLGYYDNDYTPIGLDASYNPTPAYTSATLPFANTDSLTVMNLNDVSWSLQNGNDHSQLFNGK